MFNLSKEVFTWKISTLFFAASVNWESLCLHLEKLFTGLTFYFADLAICYVPLLCVLYYLLGLAIWCHMFYCQLIPVVMVGGRC